MCYISSPLTVYVSKKKIKLNAILDVSQNPCEVLSKTQLKILKKLWANYQYLKKWQRFNKMYFLNKLLKFFIKYAV